MCKKDQLLEYSIQDIIDMISTDLSIEYDEAMNKFYNSEVFEKIRTLFELTQYKFIMQQDNNTKGLLSEIFSGQLTDTEINAIPNFSTGDCILVINGDKNIRFNIEISDREKYLFKGGA